MKPVIEKDLRIEALKRFAIAITILNIVGHSFLGFEQSWAHAVVALATTYSLEIFFEWLNCRLYGGTPKYRGSIRKAIYFLLPAHITALAVSMLLFTNENLMPVVFASAIAICSKILLRIKVRRSERHFLNPSNTGIAVVLILFPWIGIAPPYQFTENISGVWDWLLPAIFISVGSMLNTKLTKRMPLILAWFGGFFLQAIIRSLILGTPVWAALNPMTGVAFLLFSFYMISDPATTPVNTRDQVIFGSAVAFVYSALVLLHVVFGQFFALLIVCSIRGIVLWMRSARPVTSIAVQPDLSHASIEKVAEKEYYTVNQL
ncbi:MAG TPA: hypothetical protein VGB56_04480 [Flavisolibacter sp.]|jgi:hypothetical protein